MTGAARGLAIVLLASSLAVCSDRSAIVPQDHGVSSQQQYQDQATRTGLSWEAVSAVVSIIAAGLSFYFFIRNLSLAEKNAERTVTVDAQHLLLEINKQYLSDPALFAIYDDWPGRAQALQDPTFADKLKALGYLKLNVFEIVFDALSPQSDAYGAWVAYFDDSLRRCSVLRYELGKQPEIYGTKLLAAFDRWQETGSAKIVPTTQTNRWQVPLPFTTAAVGLLLSFFLHNTVGGVAATVIGFLIGSVIVYVIGKLPAHG